MPRTFKIQSDTVLARKLHGSHDMCFLGRVYRISSISANTATFTSSPRITVYARAVLIYGWTAVVCPPWPADAAGIGSIESRSVPTREDVFAGGNVVVGLRRIADRGWGNGSYKMAGEGRVQGGEFRWGGPTDIARNLVYCQFW
jgi:hypothetical protein